MVKTRLVGLIVLFALSGFVRADNERHRDPAPIPDDVVRSVVDRMRERSVEAPVVSRLKDTMGRTSSVVAGFRSKIAGGRRWQRTAEDSMLIEGQLRELAAIKDAFRQQDHGFNVSRETSAAIEARFAELDGALGRLQKADSDTNYRRALDAATSLLSRMSPPANLPGEASSRDFPFQRYIEAIPSTKAVPSRVLPKYVQMRNEDDLTLVAGPAVPLSLSEGAAAGCSFTPEDLAATPDVQLDDEIRTLARTLDYDPRKILAYVSHEIQFEPNWGATKGALGALWSKAGTSIDQSSLLIALLRASNIPARYVRGTVHIKSELARNWIGVKTNIAALKILAKGRYPTATYSPGEDSFLFSHVWVSACVPYGNYRGSRRDESQNRWVPLDPSFKQYDYKPGIAHSVNFNYTSYLTARSDDMPGEVYSRAVLSNVRTKSPGYGSNSLVDVPYAGPQVKRLYDVLPASLPYDVYSYDSWDNLGGVSEVSSLPESHRVQFSINTLGISKQFPLSDLVFKRLTLAFKGSTAVYQSQLDTWKAATPAPALPCTIQVKPVLLLDGVEVASGSIVGLCTASHDLRLRVWIPDPILVASSTALADYTRISDAVRRTDAADYSAIIVYARHGSDRMLGYRVNKLLDANRQTASPLANQDATEGEFLYIAGLKYGRYITDSFRQLARLDGVSADSSVHLGLSKSKSRVSYVFDIPYGVSLEGTLVDVLSAVSITKIDSSTFDAATDRAETANTLRLLTYSGSAYEHYIWQETARIDAVSTVRGMQYAKEMGVPLQTITPANIANFRVNMHSSMWNWESEFTAQLKDAAGNFIPTAFILAPKSTISYLGEGNTKAWVGAVFEINRPDSVTMGISGSFAANGGYGMLKKPPLTAVYNVPANYLDTGFIGSISSSLKPGGTPTSSKGRSSSMAMAGDPVNMLTGNLVHTERDIHIKSRGLPIIFERTYNSEEPADGPLGFGWTHSFNQFIRFKGVESGEAKVSWVDGTGAERFFKTISHVSGKINNGATLSAQPGVYQILTRTSTGTYEVKESNGTSYVFESLNGTSTNTNQKARLLSISDRSGNVLTVTYPTTTDVVISDALNRKITLKHNAQGRIHEIEDWKGLRRQYGYDENGNLNSFKSPLAVAGTISPASYTYYTSGQLAHAMKSYVLPRGNGMEFEYYANGKVMRHTTSQGESMSFVYNDFRRESRTINERGHTRYFFFDRDGNSVRIVQENGGEYNYLFTDTNHPFKHTSETTPLGFQTQYAYDAKGNATLVTLPSGNTVVYSHHSAFGQAGKTKDARGNHVLNKFDAKGNVLQTIHLGAGFGAAADPASYVPVASEIRAQVINTYDAYGNLRTVKAIKGFANQSGPLVTFNYDANSLNVLSISRTGDSNGDGVVTQTSPSQAYDDYGRLTTSLTSNWYTSQAQYDADGRVERATDAMNNWRDFTYDANGNVLSQRLVVVAEGLGRLADSSSAVYDQSDRKVTSIDSAGNATAFAYDAGGNVTRITNPDGYAVTFDYDDMNRVVRAYDQEGNAVAHDLDLEGKPRTITDANGTTTTYAYYDKTRDGRLKSVTDAGGRRVTYDYDENGNVVSVTDHGGANSLTTFDELNRPVRVAGPVVEDPVLGQIRGVTRNGYDTLGNLESVAAGRTDAAGATPGNDVTVVQQTYLYDDFGRKIRETDAAGKAWRFHYDIHGNVDRITDPRNIVTTQTHGYGGVLRTRSNSSGVVSYTRNALGQVTFAQSPEVSYAYLYNDAHQRIRITDSRASKSLDYEWSPGGRLNRMTGTDIGTIDYRYDAVGRLMALWDSQDSYITYVYDQGARLRQKWLANGVVSDFTYNADNTLKQLRNTAYDYGTGTTATLSQHDLTYDTLGRKKSATDKVGAFAQPAQTYAYGYDIFSNRISKTEGGVVTAYLHDLSNQLNEIRSPGAAGILIGALVYDANGNLTRKCSGGSVTALPAGAPTDCSGNEVLSLQYDADNQLERASRVGLVETYGYDDQGRRVRKTQNGVNTWYLYNGPDIVAEYQDDWSRPQVITTHGPGTDDPIVRYTRNAAGSFDKRYYHQDPLNSSVAVTDDEGVLVGTQLFDPWGNRQPGATLGRIDRYGFTGREPDASGLIYYRARYYDPTLARFTQRDPIGLAGGINQYAYVTNSPVNFTDPSGLIRANPVNGSSSLPSHSGCVAFDAESEHDDQVELVLSDAAPERLKVDTNEGSVLLAFGTCYSNGMDSNYKAPGEVKAWIHPGDNRAENQVARMIPEAAAIMTPIPVAAILGQGSKLLRFTSVVEKEITLSQRLHGEAARHAADAIAAGQPSVLTIDRAGTAANRQASLSALEKIPGKHLDEYPPAMFREGGAGASVRPINPRDNMSAGACIGNACRGLADGARVRIKIGD